MLTRVIPPREGVFEGAKEHEMFYRAWYPDAHPKGILLLVHGLGSHSGTFVHLAEFLVSHEYALYGVDLRGHGRSHGQRGYVESWQDYRSDLQAFIELVDRQTSNCNLFLVGHSLGAVVVLDFVMRMQPQLAGAIALAPALGKVGVPPVKLAVGQLLSTIWPRFTLDTGIDPAKGVRDPKLLEEFLQDPLRHTKGTARLVTEFFDTVEWIQTHPERLQVPLLILHGESDPIALSVHSASFVEQVPHWDASHRAYPQCFHDIHRDLECDSVAEDLVDWLDLHAEEGSCRLGLPSVVEIAA